MTDQNKGNSPEHRFHDGSVRATMWRNKGQYGDRFTTKIEKSYKDPETGEWKTTNYLSGTDLLKAARLAEEAYQKETTLKREQSFSSDTSNEIAEAKAAYREQSQNRDNAQEPIRERSNERDLGE